MVRVDRIELSDLRHDSLIAAARRWYQLCGASGLYPREELGFGLLVGTREIMNGRACVIATGTDDPLDFVIAVYGADLKFYEGRSLVAHRFRDLPDRDVAEAAVTRYRDVVSRRRPMAFRMIGDFDRTTIDFDQLVLPTIDDNGRVDRLVTVTAERSRRPRRKVTLEDALQLLSALQQLDLAKSRASTDWRRHATANVAQADRRSASMA